MGRFKEWVYEIQWKGDWPENLEGKYLCSDHYDDPYIYKKITKNAKPGVCSYCGKQTDVWAVDDFAKEVVLRIHSYYNDVNDESYYLASSFYDDDEEEIAGAKRLGQFIVPSDLESYETTFELMEELGLISNSEELDNDIESVFSTQAWVKRNYGVPEKNVKLVSEWQRFAKEVTEDRRFTFLAKPEFQHLAMGNFSGDDILSKLSRMIREQGLCFTLKKDTILYRARNVDDIIKEYGFKDITSAPANTAFPNRMSPAGISMFYGSFEKKVAEEECVGKGIGCIVGYFRLRYDLRVIDLTMIPKPSFWMDYWQENLFLHKFHSEITKTHSEQDMNKMRYVPTQVFTEFLRYMFQEEGGSHVDGLVYGSAKEKGKRNVVLFCNQKQSEKYVELVKLERKHYV